MPDELEAEIASEHHDRITEAEHEAEQAAEQAEQAAKQVFDVEAALQGKADVIHEHPEYVTHEHLSSALEEHARRAEEAASRAESAADDAEDAMEHPAESEDVAGGTEEADTLPLPEPEQEEVRIVRRHGRYRR